MLFNSIEFLVFFFILVTVSFLSPAKFIKHLVLIASIFFYTFWYPPYLLLLLLSVFIDYFACIKIEEAHSSSRSHSAKIYLYSAVALNVFILFLYKYAHFAASIFHFKLPETMNWALPLGISFFTFQTLACTIDVYKQEVSAKKNFLDFLFYISFFPQLIAGPILRLKDDWSLLMNIAKPKLSSLNSGIYLIIWGLVKKIVIADNLALLVERSFSDPSALDNSFVALISLYAFAIQIYCDFSGYVDVAIGIARVFSIELPANFNYPYFSCSVSEFWRRWHITLSSWLRDYVYIPLGGSYASNTRTAFNLLVTMLIGGLWHGANLTFLVWGALHGSFLVLEKFLFDKVVIPKFFSVFLCFNFVSFSWIFFRAKSLTDAIAYIQRLFDFSNFTIADDIWSYILFMSLCLIAHFLSLRFSVKNKLHSMRNELRILFLVFAVLLIIVFGAKEEARFIYFDF